MRSEIYSNALTILEAVEILGLNPYLVGQVLYVTLGDEELISEVTRKTNSQCDNCWFEYTHHRNAPSRYELQRAIAQAERLFLNVFGFYPAPTWKKYTINPRWRSIYFNQRCRANCKDKLKKVSLPVKKTIKLGMPYRVQHEIDVVIERDDLDADTIEETFHFAVNVPDDVENDQIHVYYALTDIGGMIKGQNQRQWEIRPLVYGESIDNGDGTREQEIFFYVYQGINPKLMVSERVHCTNTMVNSDYIDKVDVWLEYFDETNQGYFVCKGGDCVATEVNFCGEIENAESSIIVPVPATRECVDEDDLTTCTLETDSCRDDCNPCRAGCNFRARIPREVVVHTVSGLPRQEDGRMDYIAAQIISWLAASLIKCKPCGCGCECDKGQLSWYSSVYHEVINKTVIVPHDPLKLNNPFGASNGAVMAWELARQEGYTVRGGKFFLGAGR